MKKKLLKVILNLTRFVFDLNFKIGNILCDLNGSSLYE